MNTALKNLLKKLEGASLKENISTSLSSQGFTLIEILVVITLVGLLSGIGVFSIVSYGNNQSLSQTVGDVKGIFDQAKFNAVSSVNTESNELGNNISCGEDLVAYRVELSQTEERVRLYMECEESSELIKIYTLPEDLDLTSGCEEVRYEAVELKVEAVPLLPCTIEIAGFGQSRSIEVNTLGRAKIINN